MGVLKRVGGGREYGSEGVEWEWAMRGRVGVEGGRGGMGVVELGGLAFRGHSRRVG